MFARSAGDPHDLPLNQQMAIARSYINATGLDSFPIARRVDRQFSGVGEQLRKLAAAIADV